MSLRWSRPKKSINPVIAGRRLHRAAETVWFNLFINSLTTNLTGWKQRVGLWKQLASYFQPRLDKELLNGCPELFPAQILTELKSQFCIDTVKRMTNDNDNDATKAKMRLQKGTKPKVLLFAGRHRLRVNDISLVSYCCGGSKWIRASRTWMKQFPGRCHVASVLQINTVFRLKSPIMLGWCLCSSLSHSHWFHEVPAALKILKSWWICSVWNKIWISCWRETESRDLIGPQRASGFLHPFIFKTSIFTIMI